MRLDDAGPRTWLLAALAGWALLAWLLAVAGMGGRIDRLADNPGLLKPVPPVSPAPPLRLGPLGQYSQIAARSLFAKDRRPHPFFLQGEGEMAQESGFDYVLTSVLITPELKMAILQPVDAGIGMGPGAEPGRSVRVELNAAPESHPAWRLIGLKPRSAVFAGPEGQRTLELRVYDGIGGAPPTAVQPADVATDEPRPGQPPKLLRPPSEPAPPAIESTAPEADPGSAADPMAPPEAEPSQPLTDQQQMEAIRERIQSRREQMRRQSSKQPPAKPVE